LRLNNIRINKRLICCAVCALLGLITSAQVDTFALSHRIDSIVNHAIEAGAMPGARVLIRHKGEVLIDRAYGFHTYDSIDQVKPDDIYDFASITKVTTVLPALMLLVDRGQFDLDATLADYYPDFRKTNKADLPWRRILAHDAKIQSWIAYWEKTVKKNGKFRARTFKSRRSRRYPIEVTEHLFLHKNYRKKMIKAIKKSPLNEDEGYVYSGLAFYLLPEIIENITGTPFETFLRDEVYSPIGAGTLGYNPLTRFPVGRIVPTERDTFFRMTQIQGRVHDEGAAMMGGVSGNAGLFGTAEDLSKMATLYLNRGIWQGDTIISPLVVDEFTRCQYCYKGNKRGLGFDKPPWSVEPEAESVTISPEASAESYGHSGYTGTLIWVDPTYDLTFVFLSNRVYPTRMNWKINELKVRPAIHQAAYDVILSENR